MTRPSYPTHEPDGTWTPYYRLRYAWFRLLMKSGYLPFVRRCVDTLATFVH